MMRSLFVKIYLTVLASLAVVAVASGLFFHAMQDRDQRGFGERRDRFISALIPPANESEYLQQTVERLARAVHGDISVFAHDGRLLAQAGRPIPPDILARPGVEHRHGDWFFSDRLPDGRLLAARMDEPPGPIGRSPLLFMALIAVAIGIAAYPVVRHLTRRLELLRVGMEKWGDGDLSLRAEITGSDEVAAVARTFNQAAAHIEALMNAHRALLANASHELRSPLARLRMALDLHDEQPGPRTREEILRNLAELDALVEEILLASRLDHQGTASELVPVDLMGIVAEEGARNGVEVSGAPATVSGDATLLHRLARNLMQNALRHGAPPVTAEVTSEPAGTVVLSVTDHGPGVPEAARARVFEPFYRPAGHGETAGGWGLGLSLVSQIARLHGATVACEAPAGGGARFVVRFPAATT